jgi:hypothetical protein
MPRLSFKALSNIPPEPKPDNRRAATAQPLLLGACVRFHSKDMTGIVVGSVDSSRVRVRWDDTGEVTTCLRAKLMLVR